MRRAPEEVVREAIRLRLDLCLTIRDVAIRVGYSTAAVERWLVRRGVVLGPRGRKPRRDKVVYDDGPIGSAGHPDITFAPPEVLAERDRAFTREIDVGRDLLGDPAPGRSALDKRSPNEVLS